MKIKKLDKIVTIKNKVSLFLIAIFLVNGTLTYSNNQDLDVVNSRIEALESKTDLIDGKLKKLDEAITLVHNKNVVIGENECANSEFSIVSGEDNKLVYVKKSSIFGEKNKINSFYYSNLYGKENGIISSEYLKIFGDKNHVEKFRYGILKDMIM